MPQTIGVPLSAEGQSELMPMAGDSESLPQIIAQAAEEYVFFRRFRLLRERMIAQAQAQGVRTDEDVFERVS